MKRQQGTVHMSIHARLMCVDESAMVRTLDGKPQPLLPITAASTVQESP